MTDPKRYQVLVIAGDGVRVVAMIRGEVRSASVRPGRNTVTTEDLEALMLSPKWLDRQAEGEILVVREGGGDAPPGTVGWSNVLEDEVLDLVELHHFDIPALIAIRDQEHRIQDKRPRVLVAIYEALSLAFFKQGRRGRARRAGHKANRWRKALASQHADPASSSPSRSG